MPSRVNIKSLFNSSPWLWKGKRLDHQDK